MKTRFALLFLSFFASIVYSQVPFAPAGAVWYYSYDNEFSSGYIRIVNLGDTLIDGKNCRILQKTQYGFSFPGNYDTLVMSNEYIYNDSDKVFYFRKGGFFTLYDFGATVGTSWKVVGNAITNNVDSGQVYVDSTGFEVINGDSLRVIYATHIAGSCIGWWNAKIIERIGCVNEYFFPDYVSCVVDANEGGALRCYSDNTFSLYNTGLKPSCDYILSIDGLDNKLFGLSVFPNPTSNFLKLQTKDNSPLPQGTLQIFNIQGALQMELAIPKHQNQLQLNLSHLPAGLYLGRIVSSTGEGGWFRFVKE
jgi:hypothetical protein